MRKIVLLSTLVLFAACTKKEPNTVSEQRFTCVCNTVVTFVDHCGEAENRNDTSYVSSASRSEAESSCSKQNSTVTTNYTISTTSCALK